MSDNPKRIKWSSPAEDEERANNRKLIIGLAIGATVGVVALALIMRYKVAAPHQYLVKTGLGITDMAVSKKTFMWPFQELRYICMNPRNYSFKLHNMSKESVEFHLPVVFTIGPTDPNRDLEGFKSYTRLLSDISYEDMAHTINGVIQGETRILSANMTIEEMFADRDKFRNSVQDKIGVDLAKFGLQIYNANIEEMSDAQGNEYFKYRRQQALQGAVNQARVAVAEAKKLGDIGENERKAESRRRIAEVEAETVLVENDRRRMIAESETKLKLAQIDFEKSQRQSQIEATLGVDQRQMELQKELEIKRLDQQTSQHRANLMSKTAIDVEAKIREAEGYAQATVKRAEGDAMAKIKAAEGTATANVKMAEADAAVKIKSAEGESVSIKLLAEAQLEKDQKTGAGAKAQLLQEADGLTQFNNNPLAPFYLGLKSGLYKELAEANAKAINGLQPKINIWNTGAADGQSNTFSPIQNLFQTLPPMLDVIQQQTDIKLPFITATPPQTPSPSMATDHSNINLGNSSSSSNNNKTIKI
ncbi:hypothetical protein SAMD00019534_059800 [Acytostelium subglobosum LB1]|uniref:hypothetical protein n=1 Tax=Acytostelium subglobosum LB1 TaxID=1410327 RepID=UPI000644F2F6|nr:hypothetical protein SAMD00019534_059800 [Acytostelium subglobosum LB1]GAM22805.1 hypothetical protein SAMD00019534_059800 [Acytostelium subglobosum LB1]|eukprot:XP_012754032.1 hypothetical protein SAMD00019534_059800 [Acytostelium subglobosum LB1]